VAAAWLKESPAVVLDEPFAGLDPKAAAELAELLRTLRAQGRALLIAMHDLFWAQQLADHAGILLEGRQVLTRSREGLRGESLEKLYLDYVQGGARAAAV
jgi:ABC-type multidrug transport system ATPase subunit